MTRPVIGFAGMTHLGINSAAAAAARGFRAVCFDADVKVVQQLSTGDLPVVEPGLAELMREHRARLSFASDAARLADCDAVYIASDVTTDSEGRSDLTAIRSLIDAVVRHLGERAVLVVLCQVPPGFTRGLEAPQDRLFYQVETLVFGRAVERALNPERIVVGCADPARPLTGAYREFLDAFGCPVLTMRYESAELAKIAINCCLVASIAAANTLAELCEKIGADWSEIVPALKLDKRIGPHAYLAPGLGIAGGNLERDLATVCALADLHGTDARVVRAWIANSGQRRDWALRILHREVLSKTADPVVAVLGLAYKQDTDSTKNSASLALLEALRPFRVRAFDPVVPASAANHPSYHGAQSALEACDGADALAVMTPWSQFSRLDPREIAKRLRGTVVLDPYAVLDAAGCRAAGLRYHTLGAGS